MAKESVNKFKNRFDKEAAKGIVGSKIDTPDVAVTIDVQENNNDTVVENDSNSYKVMPKKTMANAKANIKVEKLGVSLQESVVKKVKILGKSSGNKKTNDVVVQLLSEIYDGENFNVDFVKRDKQKVTSFNLPADMVKSIEAIAKKNNLPKSEVLNRLLEEALKEYY